MERGGWGLERNAQKELLMRDLFLSLFLITKLSGKTLSLEPKRSKNQMPADKEEAFC